MAIGPNADKGNYCPFGCQANELDEHGYCAHLVGFTNDGKTMEPITLATPEQREAGMQPIAVRGRKRFRQEIQKRDRTINPRLVSKDPRSGVPIEFDKWVSSRVYRHCTAEEKQAWIERQVDADFEEEDATEQMAEV